MEAGDRGRIAEKLGGMRAGGGTNLLTALQEGYRAMRGGARQGAPPHHSLRRPYRGRRSLRGPLPGHRRRRHHHHHRGLRRHDANIPLMQRIAGWGKGRFYFTDDPLKIPRIFTTETIVVSRGLIVEEQIEPRLSYPGEMLEGFAPNAYPPLSGYILTFAKPSAQVLLAAERGDPLLVTWHYGLGKAGGLYLGHVRALGRAVGWCGPSSAAWPARWRAGPCAAAAPSAWCPPSRGRAAEGR